MSSLHSHSCECMKSELDLFSLPPSQRSIEGSQWVHYKPVSSPTDDSPMEFVIPDQGNEYIDLAHTLLSVRFKLITPKKTAENTSSAESVGPVSNLLHHMFNYLDVYFNQKPVSPPNNAYAYRAYIESLLNYGPAAKKSHFTSALWLGNIAGKMENITTQNQGLVDRRLILGEGGKNALIGHLHSEVFNQDRFLLNGVELRVRLVRSKDAFCPMDPTNRAYLHILLAHAKALSPVTAKYPLTKVEV
ncbi:uncharacterized protein F54H12.2-like [Belonocnema kinseyi]|uniref:uncharacterized protein F54H12.2-like n=1 Tax=Belonocnema kinseyi TaxID=2817044 RepID=UPI00143CC29D|nr:uncharacterized protein F54H12.2-like [Belonocnema kinseyi]